MCALLRTGGRPPAPTLTVGAAVVLLAGSLAGCSAGDAGDGPSGEAFGPPVPTASQEVVPSPAVGATTESTPAAPGTDGAGQEGAGAGAGEGGAREAGAGEAGAREAGAGEAGAGEDGAGEDGAVEDEEVAPAPRQPDVPVAPREPEGDLQPVPTPSRPTLDPVDLEDSVDAGDELSVRLVDVEQVEVTGRGPGERSGSALAVDVEVVNAGTTPLDVPGLAVSVAYAGTEASPVDAPPADQVVGPVPARSRVSGTYVFLVPEDQLGSVLVRVGLGESQPVVVFEGRVTG